jgi:hypothetical protein
MSEPGALERLQSAARSEALGATFCHDELVELQAAVEKSNTPDTLTMASLAHDCLDNGGPTVHTWPHANDRHDHARYISSLLRECKFPPEMRAAALLYFITDDQLERLRGDWLKPITTILKVDGVTAPVLKLASYYIAADSLRESEIGAMAVLHDRVASMGPWLYIPDEAVTRLTNLTGARLIRLLAPTDRCLIDGPVRVGEYPAGRCQALR